MRILHLLSTLALLLPDVGAYNHDNTNRRPRDANPITFCTTIVLGSWTFINETNGSLIRGCISTSRPSPANSQPYTCPTYTPFLSGQRNIYDCAQVASVEGVSGSSTPFTGLSSLEYFKGTEGRVASLDPIGTLAYTLSPVDSENPAVGPFVTNVYLRGVNSKIGTLTSLGVVDFANIEQTANGDETTVNGGTGKLDMGKPQFVDFSRPADGQGFKLAYSSGLYLLQDNLTTDRKKHRGLKARTASKTVTKTRRSDWSWSSGDDDDDNSDLSEGSSDTGYWIVSVQGTIYSGYGNAKVPNLLSTNDFTFYYRD